jgi:hypothetical protein
MKGKKLWVSTTKFTGQVNVDDKGYIIFTPNVWRRFKGQPFANLRNWLFNDLHLDIRVEEL